ncbi:MAG: hypothetical protein BZY80_01625 [SAR202 cluster bacterium Io17-Chloro-G2]|nr:MAG: hypothetical protein BZY80_01625 [SAR202 cluster bacterium Io17-Chloro-G2]
MRVPRRLFGSPLMLLIGFILLILMGGLVLALPVSSHSGEYTSLDTSFFTAVSALTVTGHTVVSTGTYWSGFGQALIFTLMLVGGLGFMVVSTFLLLLIGHRSTLQERMLTQGLMQDTVGVEQFQGLRRIGRRVVILVFSLYALGTSAIFWQVRGHPELDLSMGEALWNSMFLSVSSFNNAGLNILPELPDGSSLARFADSPLLLMGTAALMILGGLGWTVLVDIYRNRRFVRLSLDTKLVVVTSLSLWALGAAVLLIAEWGNPETLGQLGWFDKGVGALFESVSGRTAGFSTMDFGQVQDVTKVTYSGLMFIGGAAGSVAGGIKVVTFAIIVAAVVSSLRQRAQAEAFGREIPQPQLYRALAVAVLGLGFIAVAVPVLTITDPDVPFLNLVFDTVSALGTTGASTGVTPGLSLAGKCMFMIAMFVGRLGPVTLALTLAPREEASVYRFARERVKIG